MNTQIRINHNSVLKRLGGYFLTISMAVTFGAGVAGAGPIMHVHDSGGNLGTVDAATGSVNIIGNMGVQMTDIAFDSSGNLFGLTFDGLYSINTTTAASTFIGNHSIQGGNAFVFGSDGTLYAAGNSTTSLFTINTLTGVSTNIGNMGFSSGGDLAFNNGNFYLASNSNELIRIDLSNIENSSSVGNFGVGGVFGLATGDDGLLYAVANTDIYTVDITTGLVTNSVSFAGQGLSAAFGHSFINKATTTGTTPEPSMLALLAIGLIGLVGFMRYYD